MGAIEIEVKEKLIDAEAKKVSADAIAEVVGKEKAIVNVENDKANIVKDECEVIAKNVNE